MELITVDYSKCTKCGLCTKVCPGIISMGKNGPEEKYPDKCIGCGQCTAVCPQAAIDNTKAPLAAQTAIKNTLTINKDAALQFLRSRRSIRAYKKSAVPREELLQLVNIARFAPTAGNLQGISYTIIEDKEVLKKATAITIEWMEDQVLNIDQIHWSFIHRSFTKQIRGYREDGLDTVLRDAPHLILATAKKDFARGRENTIFSLAYLELYAPMLGLGSCWAGLLEMCLFAKHEPLLRLFNIPEESEITGAVMVGYPKYRYQRMVERNPLDVSWI